MWIAFMLIVTLGALAISGLASLGVFSGNVPDATKTDKYGREGFGTRRVTVKTPIILAALAVWVVLSIVGTGLASYKQVDAGEVGVVRAFGEITGTVDEGPHFVAPWKTVTTINIQAQSTFFGITEDDGELVQFPTLSAASSETQDLFITLAVVWRVDGLHVGDLVREVGTGYFEKAAVEQKIAEAVKETTTGYLAIETPGKRSEIASIAKATLNEKLAPFYLTVDSINIQNIGFSSQFNDAIENKQQATQDALAATERVKIAQADAQKAVATAKGVADAAIEAARGEAEKIRLESEAQAEANTVIAESLTEDLIRLRALESMPGVTVFLPSDGTINLLDIAAALGSEAP